MDAHADPDQVRQVVAPSSSSSSNAAQNQSTIVFSGPSALHLASKHGTLYVILFLVVLVLYHAPFVGHAACVQLLLNCGAQSNLTDHTGCTPLHMAARYGSNEDSPGQSEDSTVVVRSLVDHKAAINSVMLDGSTPLLLVQIA